MIQNVEISCWATSEGLDHYHSPSWPVLAVWMRFLEGKQAMEAIDCAQRGEIW